MANVTQSVEIALEELNESEVSENIADLSGTLECLGTVETIRDFRDNVAEAIKGAEKLLRSLRDLQATVQP